MTDSISKNEVHSLPPDWETGVLADYIEPPEYGYTDSATSERRGPLFLRITDIQDGNVNWDTVPYCSCPPDVLANKRLISGDILVARIGGTTGKSLLIESCPDAAVFASYLIRLRASSHKLL